MSLKVKNPIKQCLLIELTAKVAPRDYYSYACVNRGLKVIIVKKIPGRWVCLPNRVTTKFGTSKRRCPILGMKSPTPHNHRAVENLSGSSLLILLEIPSAFHLKLLLMGYLTFAHLLSHCYESSTSGCDKSVSFYLHSLVRYRRR